MTSSDTADLKRSDAEAYDDAAAIAEYQSAVIACALAASVLLQHDLPRILLDISRAEAVGPFVDPTLFRKAAVALEQDKALMKAANVLREAGATMQAHVAAASAQKGGSRG